MTADPATHPAEEPVAAPSVEPLELLGNLLARIHRDGGHHTGKVGLVQSYRDADRRVAEMYASEPGAAPAEPDECDNCHALMDGNIASTSEVCFDCWRTAKEAKAALAEARAEVERLLILGLHDLEARKMNEQENAALRERVRELEAAARQAHYNLSCAANMCNDADVCAEIDRTRKLLDRALASNPAPAEPVVAADLREAAGALLDALVLPGYDLPAAWERACLLFGRYCEPFLSWKPAESTPPSSGAEPMTEAERTDYIFKRWGGLLKKLAEDDAGAPTGATPCPETAAHGVHACMLRAGHEGDHQWDTGATPEDDDIPDEYDILWDTGQAIPTLYGVTWDGSRECAVAAIHAHRDRVTADATAELRRQLAALDRENSRLAELAEPDGECNGCGGPGHTCINCDTDWCRKCWLSKGHIEQCDGASGDANATAELRAELEEARTLLAQRGARPRGLDERRLQAIADSAATADDDIDLIGPEPRVIDKEGAERLRQEYAAAITADATAELRRLLREMVKHYETALDEKSELASKLAEAERREEVVREEARTRIVEAAAALAEAERDRVREVNLLQERYEAAERRAEEAIEYGVAWSEALQQCADILDVPPGALLSESVVPALRDAIEAAKQARSQAFAEFEQEAKRARDLPSLIELLGRKRCFAQGQEESEP